MAAIVAIAQVRTGLALFLVWSLWGCQTPTIPDPNDPFRATPDQAQVLWNDFGQASQAAQARVLKGEISQDQANALLSSYAKGIDKAIDPKTVPPDRAWMCGDILRNAKDWPRARDVLTIAVLNAKNNDRRVNDSLSLAEVYCHLGNISKAIELSSSTFNANPEDKAPILPAVLFRIMPAAKGHGHDADLAILLSQAIRQHELTRVNPSTEAGRVFLIARPTLIHRAWEAALDLAPKGSELSTRLLNQWKRDPIDGSELRGGIG